MNAAEKLRRHVDLYMGACYKGQHISPTQRREVEQAFVGGALIAFELINEASDKPEDAACADLDALHAACVEYSKTFRPAVDPRKQ